MSDLDPSSRQHRGLNHVPITWQLAGKLDRARAALSYRALRGRMRIADLLNRRPELVVLPIASGVFAAGVGVLPNDGVSGPTLATIGADRIRSVMTSEPARSGDAITHGGSTYRLDVQAFTDSAGTSFHLKLERELSGAQAISQSGAALHIRSAQVSKDGIPLLILNLGRDDTAALAPRAL